jgi:hypothetical protein
MAARGRRLQPGRLDEGDGLLAEELLSGLERLELAHESRLDTDVAVLASALIRPLAYPAAVLHVGDLAAGLGGRIPDHAAEVSHAWGMG